MVQLCLYESLSTLLLITHYRIQVLFGVHIVIVVYDKENRVNIRVEISAMDRRIRLVQRRQKYLKYL